jgi:hypothetical protein
VNNFSAIPWREQVTFWRDDDVYFCASLTGWGLTGWGLTGWGLTGWGLTGWGLTGWGLTGWVGFFSASSMEKTVHR